MHFPRPYVPGAIARLPITWTWTLTRLSCGQSYTPPAFHPSVSHLLSCQLCISARRPADLAAEAHPPLTGIDTEAAEQVFSIANRWQANLSICHGVSFLPQRLLLSTTHRLPTRIILLLSCDPLHTDVVKSTGQFSATECQLPQLKFAPERHTVLNLISPNFFKCSTLYALSSSMLNPGVLNRTKAKPPKTLQSPKAPQTLTP